MEAKRSRRIRSTVTGGLACVEGIRPGVREEIRRETLKEKEECVRRKDLSVKVAWRGVDGGKLGEENCSPSVSSSCTDLLRHGDLLYKSSALIKSDGLTILGAFFDANLTFERHVSLKRS